jgi:DNA-directed RNA polymerase specialized sigma subunit
MSIALDDYIYCSPYLSVLSLDTLFERPAEEGRSFDVPDYQQPAAEIAIDRDREYLALHGAVWELPPRQRAVIQALFFMGCTVTQTAHTLQISCAAVVKLRTKALSRLFNLLAPQRDAFFH